MAGIISGVIPTAIARENSSASMQRASQPTLMMKTNDCHDNAATVTSIFEKPRRPAWKAVSGGRSVSPDGDPAEPGRRAGGHHDAAP